ncbi:MAG TPA: hypothetical protein PKD99_12405 [Sphingopyxis sp.]|nr:hypothetical protein [Sphingopyxis sp.]HMP45900.1 hypothetical protein [Sphingopyxis sp.]
MPTKTADPQGERTYPRKWYRVSQWMDAPQALTFERETRAFLFAGECRTVKRSRFAQWYPTLEEAEAVIAARKANKTERTRLELIRDAAPELLAAANEAFDFLGGVDGASDIRHTLLAAISKATSRQPEGER